MRVGGHSVERAAPLASDSAATDSSRLSTYIAAGSILTTGVILAALFFPLLFNRWLERDDEGVFEYTLREFLTHHGHLYSTIWSDFYGPFYYLTMSTVYRVIHRQPTLDNARWIVLILTVASAAFFAASVWRVTKNLPCALLSEIAAFLILIQIAGNEPLHPGSLAVFLISVVTFEISSYAVTQRTLHLALIGAAVGALVMTKVNVGGLVAVGLVFGFIVSRRNTRRWIQIVVTIVAVVIPVALVWQNISMNWAATFAILVGLSLIGMFVLMSIDQLTLPRWPLLPMAYGAAVVVVISLAFPLVSGTPLSDEISGVFIRPLSLANNLVGPAVINLNWITVVLAVGAIYAAVAFRSLSKESIASQSTWTHAALAALGLWLLGLGATVFSHPTWVVAEWLPALIALPALAFCATSSEPIRLTLRLVVILAILQILVAYPVAGSQVGWGTVVMVVPCAIALAAGIDHSEVWRRSGIATQCLAVGSVFLALIIAINVWPPNIWKVYLQGAHMNLPGTGLMRIDPPTATTLQTVTQILQQHCDTFYGVPSENSFYVFSGLTAPTAMLANGGPNGLTVDQQLQVVQGLQAATAANERVCILRDSSQPVVLPPGALTNTLNEYSSVVGAYSTYTVSRLKP